MPDQHAVDVEDLVKVYPGGTRAVSGINFTVAQGEFLAFWAPTALARAPRSKCSQRC